MEPKMEPRDWGLMVAFFLVVALVLSLELFTLSMALKVPGLRGRIEALEAQVEALSATTESQARAQDRARERLNDHQGSIADLVFDVGMITTKEEWEEGR